MKEGKISQAVLERSVIRPVKSTNENILTASHIGGDFSLVSAEKSNLIVLSSRTVIMKEDYDLKYGFLHLVNHVSCARCTPVGVMVSILFPVDYEETVLKEIIKTTDLMCYEFGMGIIGGNTSVTSCVDIPVITLNCMGLSSHGENTHNVVNKDIVIINNIACEGTVRAVSKYRDRLLEKLPANLIDKAESFVGELSAVKEAYYAYEAGALCVHAVGEGGIFAGLWEFAYERKTGISVELKKIPIHQETVEICEILGINPYQFMSTGALIAAVDDGRKFCRMFEEKGMKAVVCGQTDSSNDKVIINEDEKRHIVPAMQDCIYNLP